MRLRENEYMPHAPVSTGVVRINHIAPHCVGESKSMSIERCENGDVRAKCFRCGAVGYQRLDTSNVDSVRSQARQAVARDPSTEGEERGLGRTTRDPECWPLVAYTWLFGWGLTKDEVRDHHISYDEDNGRLVLPIWWEGEKVGYQSRRLYDKDKGPKYVTRSKGGVGFMSTIPNNEPGIVIVEDIISAIKVGRVQRSIALLSTSPSMRVKKFLSQHDKFWVWLDMDNPQVIRQALKLRKFLENFGEAKLIHTIQDPKAYGEDEIRRQLYAT